MSETVWIDAAAPIYAVTGDSFVLDASIETSVTFAPAAPGAEVALTVALMQPATAGGGTSTMTLAFGRGLRPSVHVGPGIDASRYTIDAQAADMLSLHLADGSRIGNVLGARPQQHCHLADLILAGDNVTFAGAITTFAFKRTTLMAGVGVTFAGDINLQTLT